LERITPAGARIYEILHHPEAFTVQTIAAAGHIKGRHHAKVVMVKSGGQHLMTVLPADHRADLQKLEKIAGEPASLETEEEFESLFPNCAKGAMLLFQLPASRTRGPGALGSNGEVMSVPGITRTTDASPTTSSTYYSGLNCVMLRWGQRFGSSGFRA
jgi:Aminoacyl-tRNA editing domain